MKTLDVDEAAAFLKCHTSTIEELAGVGLLIGAKIGRAWVFMEDDLIDYLRTQSRAQTRRRQEDAALRAKLNKSVERQRVVYVNPPPPRTKQRRPFPQLPELVGEMRPT